MARIFFILLLISFSVDIFSQNYDGRQKSGFDLSSGFRVDNNDGYYIGLLKYGFKKNKIGLGYKSTIANYDGILISFDRIFLSNEKFDVFFHTHFDYSKYSNENRNQRDSHFFYSEYMLGIGNGINFYFTKRFYLQSTYSVLGARITNDESVGYKIYCGVSLGLGILLNEVD